jgi:AcrR family transcriptional regulator
MKTRHRREREFQEREDKFLDIARGMITESGVASFNMDRLAEATEYSKGTIYQHFGSKEDVITALAIQSLGRRVAWFERASQFAGSTRERMYAFNAAEEIFVILQPLHFRCEMLIKMDDFAERASAERRAELESLETRCFGAVRGVIEDAVRKNELNLPPSRTAGHLVVAFAAMHLGTFTILNSFPQLLRSQMVDKPLQVLRDQVSVYMDGLGWRPLSKDSDPAFAYSRILQEVFPDESRQAALVG